MKKKKILLIGIVMHLCVFSQGNIQAELDSIKNLIINTDLIDNNDSKKIFVENFSELYKDSLNFWEIQKKLSKLKINGLKIIPIKPNNYSFKVKIFQNKLFLISISNENNYLLGEEIIKINNIPIYKLVKQIQKQFFLNHQTEAYKWLEENISNKEFMNYLTSDFQNKIKIDFQNNKTILLKYSQNIQMDNLKHTKKMFSEKSPDKWFWSYGINYGQQVFIKFNKLLCYEQIIKLKDSLKKSNYTFAKEFNIPIQQTYNPIKYSSLKQKVLSKFKKNRYKKLIIDLRNCENGTDYFITDFINSIASIKKLNRKNRIFILINKNTNYAAIKLIIKAKKELKPTIIGDTIYGFSNNSNTYKNIILNDLGIQIKIPKARMKEIVINPNYFIQPSKKHYIHGIDLHLEKALSF